MNWLVLLERFETHTEVRHVEEIGDQCLYYESFYRMLAIQVPNVNTMELLEDFKRVGWRVAGWRPAKESDPYRKKWKAERNAMMI